MAYSWSSEGRKAIGPTSFHPHLVQYFLQLSAFAMTSLQLVNQPYRLSFQLRHDSSRIFKAACSLHILNGVPLDFFILRPLLEYVDELQVGCVAAYGVDNGKGKFALCQVFAQTFVCSIESGR